MCRHTYKTYISALKHHLTHDIMQSRRSSAVDDHISHAQYYIQYEERREWKSRDPRSKSNKIFVIYMFAKHT